MYRAKISGLIRADHPLLWGLLWGMLAAGLMYLGFLASLELSLLDWRYRLRGDLVPDPRVIMVTADEATLGRYGPWPLPREYHADLVDYLTRDGAKVIVLDIIFNEPSPDPRQDQALAGALRRSGRVVLPVYSAAKVLPSGAGLFRLVPPLAEPIPSLQEAAAGIGNILVVPDADGVTRRALAGADFQGKFIPSLAWEAYRVYRQLPSPMAQPQPGMPIQLTGGSISLDSHGGFLPRFPAAPGRFPSYSYVDVLEHRVPPGTFQDRIVLVGVTARGTHDSLITPVSRQGGIMSGVEYHAAALDAFLQGTITTAPQWAEALALICLGGLSVPLFTRFRRHQFLLLAAMTTSVCLFGIWTFLRFNWWVDMAAPIATLLGGYLAAAILSLRRAEKERARVITLFGRYVSSSVLEEILRHPDVARPGGRRVQASIILADLREFTAYSRTSTPEDVMALLNDYLGELAGVVLNAGGFLDKFMGDAVMAVFGAPLHDPRHALKALDTARKMREASVAISQRRASRGLPVLGLGIGISSGEVIAGHLGNPRRLEYTVVGDAVNLAARLAALAGPGEILVSPATQSLIQIPSTGSAEVSIPILGMHPSSPFEIKGWSQPMTLYRLEPMPENKGE